MKNRPRRGFLSGVLAAALAIAMTISVSAAGFSDTVGHWASAYIDKWTTAGVLVGYPDGTFRPENNVTKAELSSILNQHFKYTTLAPNTFADVPANAWYASIIQKVVGAGVTSADASGRVYPDNALTRGEAFTMIAKAYRIAPVTGNTTFTDDAAIAADYKPYVKALQSEGSLAGYAVTGGYEIRASRLLSRAEILTVLDFVDGKHTVNPSVTPAAPGSSVGVLSPGSGGGFYAPSQPTATPVPEATATPVPETPATPTPEATATPTPVRETQDGGSDVGSVKHNASAGYTYEVTRTELLPDFENLSFFIVKVTPDDPANTLSNVKGTVGGKTFNLDKASSDPDGIYRFSLTGIVYSADAVEIIATVR
jgi:hypothetical protein